MRRSRTRPTTAGHAPGAGGSQPARVDSSRRSGAARRWAAVSVVAALSLSACSTRPSPAVHPSAPSTSASQSAPPSPTPGAPAPAGPALAIDVEVTGTAEAPALTAAATPADGATAASDGDSGLVLTATLPAPDQGTSGSGDAGAPLVRLSVTAAPGSTVTLAPDDTGAVVSAAGDLVVGFAAPEVLDSAGAALDATWEAADGASTDAGAPTDASDAPDGVVVDLVLDTGSTAGPAAGPLTGPLTVTVHLGASVVAGTEWGTREGGESLAVTPSAWGRVSGQTGYALGWADVVRREPTAQTSAMEKQFRCHQLGAPDKATWNLEPWRPDVSYLAYVAARCNPT